MKCWNLAFNSQRSKIITIVVQVVAIQIKVVKIYVATMEVLMRMERQGGN